MDAWRARWIHQTLVQTRMWNVAKWKIWSCCCVQTKKHIGEWEGRWLITTSFMLHASQCRECVNLKSILTQKWSWAVSFSRWRFEGHFSEHTFAANKDESDNSSVAPDFETTRPESGNCSRCSISPFIVPCCLSALLVTIEASGVHFLPSGFLSLDRSMRAWASWFSCLPQQLSCQLSPTPHTMISAWSVCILFRLLFAGRAFNRGIWEYQD